MSESNARMFKIVQGGLGNQFREIEFDELKGFLQPRMAANLHVSFLIGSGASMPCIPTMGVTFKEYQRTAPKSFQQLFEKFINTHGKGSEENIELFLSWLGSRVEGLSQEELNGEDEIKRGLTDALVKSIRDGMMSGLETQHVKEESHEREALTTTFQTYEDCIRRIAKLRESSNDQYDTVNLFTTNYDLFLENALDRLDYSYTDGFQSKLKPDFNVSEYSRRPVDVAHRFRDKWSIVRPFFRVYKLHGSLNWHRDAHKIIKVAEWEDNEAMVIAPTTSKYADSQGTPYSDLFRELSVELLKPDSVLFVNGFSFGDEHISDLLIQALGRPDFQLIAFVDDDLPSVKYFMRKVSGNTKVTFVTNGANNDEAYYFSTLTSLLAFHDPFEVDEEQRGLKDE